ncbi:TspO/MBR family protein [Lactococcus kimchii]|uniref:TspO/MBR family protein n=1 Tax=Lactococcus sp. S-13 TaxID=2507158 RepID=UPI001022BFDD|nr:TspO/MBR family protein [Lactococcus sp. S-13]RZI48717.1 tryptophan-rich sensory protein [Lactococcus sp. S-13]
MTKTNPLKPFLYLILFIVGIEAVGGLSGLLAGDIKGVYNQLKLPPLAPPDYLFGIVWPILYGLMAVAAYLIFRKVNTHKSEAQPALLYFSFQLILNFIWSIIFFKGYYWLGVLIILLLDIIVYLCIIKFFKISKLSGILLVPYFAWISFATYLTIAVALLN